jgi:hypothetical protein
MWATWPTLLFCLLLVSSRASGQNLTSASINGTVSDETGGALPGVSVTASSPALQVHQQASVTDASGHYRFTDLPIGVYQLRFELQGFGSLVRTGLELSAGFAARVDVTMVVGALSEDVTVSGKTAVVDLSNTRGGETVQSELLATALPGNKTMADLVHLTPGLQNTAGEHPGFMGLQGRPRWNMWGIASNNTNSEVMIDGFRVPTNNPLPDVGASEETDMKTFGNTAEVREPGVAINMVLKSGGNDFHGEGSGFYMRQPFDNLDAELKSRGVTVGQGLRYYWDIAGDFGGRIVKDRLWFFTSARDRHNQVSQAGLVLNAGPDGKYLTGDEPPAYPTQYEDQFDAKLSWQITPKYQTIGYASYGYLWSDAEVQTAPFGATADFTHTPYPTTMILKWPNNVTKLEFRGAPTSNLLFDVQGGNSHYDAAWYPHPEVLNTPAMYDRSTLMLTGSNLAPRCSCLQAQWIIDANVSYFPTKSMGGRHEFKAGYNLTKRWEDGTEENIAAGNYALEFDAGSPVEIETRNDPVHPKDWDVVYSIYGADRWQVGQRLTFNLGLRWDRQHSWVPAQCRDASQFAAANCWPEVEVLTYDQFAPRVGVAWDPTGSARSIIKATYGWFDPMEKLAGTFNQNNLVTTQYRWHDLNHNNLYDPGEVNLDPNGSDFLSRTGNINAILNSNLRTSHEHEVSLSAERQVGANTAVRGLYIFRRFRDQIESVNVLRPYSAYNIPLTRKDPGPDGIVNTPDDGGFVTIWDFDPAYAGGNFVGNENLNRPGSRDDYYNSIVAEVNRRLANGWSYSAAFNATKFHRWLIGIPASPNDNYFPLDTAWRWQFKANGTYAFPHDILVGAIVEVLNGFLGQRTYAFRAADPLGGPPLKQQSQVTLRLEPFGSEQESPQPSVDLRVAKRFRLGRNDLEASLDVLNVLNANAVKSATYVSGPSFGFVTGLGGQGSPGLMPAREIRVGARFKF